MNFVACQAIPISLLAPKTIFNFLIQYKTQSSQTAVSFGYLIYRLRAKSDFLSFDINVGGTNAQHSKLEYHNKQKWQVAETSSVLTKDV